MWLAYLITLSCDGHSPELRDISLIFVTIGALPRVIQPCCFPVVFAIACESA
jgi:hypothetical protein